MPDGSPSRRKLLKKLKAAKIIEVLKDTGRLDITEAHRRMYPNQKEISHVGNRNVMFKDGVMDEVEKILKIRDKDLLKKITPEVLAQDLLDDLNKLNELRDRGEASTEEIVKILNAKCGKQKLLGMAIGMWHAEKPVEREEAANDLLKELAKYGKQGE